MKLKLCVTAGFWTGPTDAVARLQALVLSGSQPVAIVAEAIDVGRAIIVEEEGEGCNEWAAVARVTSGRSRFVVPHGEARSAGDAGVRARSTVV